MICSKAQGILAKKTNAKTKSKRDYYRRRLREHRKKCKFCLKNNK